MIGFDERWLREELESLSTGMVFAFSASAAMRQIDNYENFARTEGRDADLLREVVLKSWSTIGFSPWVELPPLTLDAVMNLLPNEETDGLLTTFAEDAVSSAAYAIRFVLTKDLQEAIWAARRAYEAADQAAIVLMDLQPGSPESETAILHHPIVQRELTRQTRDLSLLSNGALDEVRLLALEERMFTAQETAAMKLL